MNKNVPANLAAAVAALCAGTSVVVTRLAVGEIDPITLAFYRYVVAAVCLVPLLPFVWPKVRLVVADIIKIALLGAVFFGFFPWAFSAALQYTSAARGAIGIATIPIQTLIVAALFGGDPSVPRFNFPYSLGHCDGYRQAAQSFTLTINPITATLLVGVMLGEAITPVLIVGLVLVIAGIFVANWRDEGAPVKIGTIQQE